MGLKVWLPLNGDLHNQGTSNPSISLTSGNTWASSGKIGSSSLTLTKLQTILPTSSCMTGAKEISYSYWVKVNTAWSANWLDGIRWIETNGSATSTARQEFYTNCTLIGTWYKGGAISGKAFTPGVWTHLAATINYNTGEAKFYINGILNGTTTNVDTAYYCRGDFYIGDNGVDICENDVRIYDHCLSAAEVREISQGLVLHYKLDQANINLIPINIFDSDPWKSAIAAHEIYEGRLAYRISNGILYSKTGTGTNDIFSGSIAYQANTQYTLSITWRDDYRTDNKNSSLYLRFIYSDGSTVTQMISPASSLHEWKHQSITSTSGKTVSKITTTYGNGGYLYITDLKLEIGTLDTGMLYTDGDIEDSSGYNHNGIINDPNIQFINMASRYSNCIKNSQAANSAIYPIKGECNMPESAALTFTWWMKPTTIGHQTSGIFSTSNNDLPTDHSATAANMRDSCFDCCNTSGTCVRINVESYLTLNEWHHYALTYNGSQLNFYKDGISKTTVNQSGSLKAFKYIFPFYSKAGGANRTTSGSLSDFRIYCTALDADAIRQLYEVGAKVDNKQNLHAFELVENNSKIQITKRGQVKCNELEEDEKTKFYQADQIIETNEIIEL